MVHANSEYCRSTASEHAQSDKNTLRARRTAHLTEFQDLGTSLSSIMVVRKWLRTKSGQVPKEWLNKKAAPAPESLPGTSFLSTPSGSSQRLAEFYKRQRVCQDSSHFGLPPYLSISIGNTQFVAMTPNSLRTLSIRTCSEDQSQAPTGVACDIFAPLVSDRTTGDLEDGIGAMVAFLESSRKGSYMLASGLSPDRITGHRLRGGSGPLTLDSVQAEGAPGEQPSQRKLGLPQGTGWERRSGGAGRKVRVPRPSGSPSPGSSSREGRGRRSPSGRAQGRCLPEHAQGRGLALPMRSRCGPSEAGGRARALPPRWQLREPGSGAAGAAAASERPARRALRPGPRGGNRVESWKLSCQVTPAARAPAAGLRASAAGSVAGDGGEEGSRGAARETRARL
ncbi:hypothetical protein A6R68_14962, partial [Neotoma lepida]